GDDHRPLHSRREVRRPCDDLVSDRACAGGLIVGGGAPPRVRPEVLWSTVTARDERAGAVGEIAAASPATQRRPRSARRTRSEKRTNRSPIPEPPDEKSDDDRDHDSTDPERTESRFEHERRLQIRR